MRRGAELRQVEVSVSADAGTAARAAADALATRAAEAVEARGRFAVALSGGTAPEQTYRLLGEQPLRDRVPWQAVHLFWGDERCVPPGHPRSNYGMAERALIRHLPIPAENVHRMRGELPPPEGAERYRQELEAFFGPGVPVFDLVHLGVGPDGHTCSLFPFDPLLHERRRTVAPALHRELGEWRITLTLPVVNAATAIDVLVHGAGKAHVTRLALRGPLDPVRLPIQLVRPDRGSLTWLLDRAAAPPP